MTITEFLAVVRNATLRGNALDQQAANAFVQAVEFIEQNYDLPYMRRVITQSCTDSFVLTGDDAAQLKSIEELRWFDADSRKYRMKQISPDQLVSREAGTPQGFEYFTETTTAGATTVTLEFDTTFEETTNVSLLGFFYTKVDLTAPSVQNIWLINRAQSALLARTMINLAPIMRDPGVMQMYQALWQESVGVLIAAVSSLEQGSR